MGTTLPSGSAEGAGRERLVFLLHGILLNRWFLHPMAVHLARHGFRVVNRSYPSTRRTIEEHAAELAKQVAQEIRAAPAGSEPEINFVTHSLGGLVVRYLLTHHSVPGVRRFVLLAPPNKGSLKARTFGRSFLFRAVYGRRAGAQLASEPPGIFAECGIPAGVEMGILAGVKGALLTVPGAGLEGPHDGDVLLDEAQLPGVPVKTVGFGHTSILFRRAAMEEVAHFLLQGKFKPGPEEAQFESLKKSSSCLK